MSDRPKLLLSDLVRALAGDRRFALVTVSGWLDSVATRAGGTGLEGFPVVEIDLDILLDDAVELRTNLQESVASEAEVVLLVPPIGRRDGKPSRHDMSELAARNMAAALDQTVRFISVLLPRSISGGRSRSVLGEIASERFVSAVIDLSASKLFKDVHSSLRLCLVQLDPVVPEKAILLSIDLQSADESLVHEYQQLASGVRATEHGYLLETPIDVSEGFLPSQLDPARARRIAEAAIIGKLRPLGELCEVILGLRPAVRPKAEAEPGDLPVLSARMIRGNGIAVDEVTEWLSESSSLLLEPRDLVLRSIGHAGATVTAAEVRDDDLPLVAGRNVIVIRPNAELTSAERRVIRHFIGSERFAAQLLSNHVGSIQLTVRELAEVLVPVPDDDLLGAFAAVEAAALEFESWRSEASELLEASLDGDDLGDARRRLIANSSVLRQRSVAARMLDDLGHRVATRFPLPLAYRWRTALASRGSPDALRSVLNAQEVLLAYLAIMTLTSARVAGLEIGQVKDIRGRLMKRRGGLTLGDWRAVLDEAANSKAMRRLPDAHPFAEVRDFFANDATKEASLRLTQLRNDVSHLREFGPGEMQTSLAGAWSDLEHLFLASEFVTDYPLLRILETRWDSFEARNAISYIHLAGDSPVVPRASMTVEANTVEADSLYLVDRDSELHLLRPLLVGMECPSCGHWSTFQPDRVTTDGAVEYKSLEHGHPNVMSMAMARSLATVGFLEEPAGDS